uniref:ATP synthase F0 subunit 8 n=1 Tax=Kleidocerys resedae resedae TaxID=1503485 RepID=A0A060BDW8_9HEMI|nr:ATP synthase F0 subunit 8 [Kleidocerys resedae resedae]
MPQMAPMWWEILFILFMMNMIMTSIMIHWMNLKNKNYNTKTNKMSMYMWKW